MCSRQFVLTAGSLFFAHNPTIIYCHKPQIQLRISWILRQNGSHDNYVLRISLRGQPVSQREDSPCSTVDSVAWGGWKSSAHDLIGVLALRTIDRIIVVTVRQAFFNAPWLHSRSCRMKKLSWMHVHFWIAETGATFFSSEPNRGHGDSLIQ